MKDYLLTYITGNNIVNDIVDDLKNILNET